MKKWKFNQAEFKVALRRWFQFNYHTIGIYITLIGTVLYTATMPTHIRSVYNLMTELSAFYMFMLMLLATIQIFDAVSYAKKRSPFGFILFTVVTLLNTYFAYQYVTVILTEVSERQDLVMQAYMSKSILLTISGGVLFILATIYNGFIVNWKYVKEEE